MRCQKHKLLSLLTFLLLLSTLQICNSQSRTDKLQNDLAAYLNHLHETKQFSGEILIAKNTEIIFHQAIGMASRELEVPMMVDSKFHIASITKTFTGTLVALALSEGLIKKDDRAIDYLPKLTQLFGDITIHQLLTHTSGLPHNETIKDYWQVKSRLEVTTSQMIEEINQLKLLSKPGKEFSYSSLGYYLLAIILEQIYEKDYHAILEESILKKLKMESTGSANTLKVIKGLTSGYHHLPNDSLVKAPYRNYSMLKGAGDLYASARDLMTWNESFLKEIILSTADQNAIFKPGNQIKPYGYGWYIDQSKHTRYFHGGGTWGYSSYNAYYPDEKLSIIVLSNVSTQPMTVIGEKLEALTFGESVAIPKTIQTANSALPATAYTGNYKSSSNQMILGVRMNEDVLYAQLQGNPPFKLTPIGGHKFFGKQIDIALNFQLVEGRVVGLEAERMGKKFEFKKQ